MAGTFQMILYFDQHTGQNDVMHIDLSRVTSCFTAADNND